MAYLEKSSPVCLTTTEECSMLNMIDPLSAIGLASSILQLVDFSCKLVSDGYEIYETGTLGGADELELVTRDLVRLANDLTKHRPRPTTVSSDDDGGLQKLAASCTTVADQLLHVLSSVKPRAPHDGVESFRKALRLARRRGAIENLEKRLEKFQNHLNIRLISMLSNKQSEVPSAVNILTAEAKQNDLSITEKLDSMRLEVLAAARQQQRQPRYLRGLITQDEESNNALTCKNLAAEAKRIAASRKILKSLQYEHF